MLQDRFDYGTVTTDKCKLPSTPLAEFNIYWYLETSAKVFIRRYNTIPWKMAPW
jgi:hypothetical protein